MSFHAESESGDGGLNAARSAAGAALVERCAHALTAAAHTRPHRAAAHAHAHVTLSVLDLSRMYLYYINVIVANRYLHTDGVVIA